MKSDIDEISEVSQALDYLSEQSYSDEEKDLLIKLFEDQDFDVSLDELNKKFPGKGGVISRLNIIFKFAQKNKKDRALMEDLCNEIIFLISDLSNNVQGSLDL